MLTAASLSSAASTRSRAGRILRDAYGAGLLASAVTLVAVRAFCGAWGPAAIAALAQAALLALAAQRLRSGDLHPHSRLGVANRITVFRSSLVAVLAAMTMGGQLTPPFAWLAIAVGVAALILDGYDGYFARRDGTASPFGAWLDQEIDAALVAALAFLVYRSTGVGAVILVSGGLRYAFLGARGVWPRMRGELAFSQRRRVCCVVQIGALLVCLVPVLPASLVHSIAIVSVAMLTASFAIDVVDLANRPRRA